MNTAQILSILTRYVPHCYKVGVYPKDKIPSTLPKRSCIVINTDPSDRPGEHWLALFVLDHLEFFDSYAFPPSFYGLKFASAIPALTHSAQSLQGDTCGEHCVLFLVRRSHGFSLSRIRSSYSNDLVANDRSVRARVSKMSRNLVPVPLCTNQCCCKRACVCNK